MTPAKYMGAPCVAPDGAAVSRLADAVETYLRARATSEEAGDWADRQDPYDPTDDLEALRASRALAVADKELKVALELLRAALAALAARQ